MVSVTKAVSLWLLLGTQIAHAQPYTETLLKDLNPSGSSNPEGFVAVGGRVFFTAELPTTGVELWVTGGSSGDTQLVRDIEPGIGPSFPAFVTPFGDLAIFRAKTTPAGLEPWITDGTQAGTMILRDVTPGSASSYPTEFVELGDHVLFQADDGVSGQELWITDGTPAGTVLLADIFPGAGSSNPQHLSRIGDLVYFSATRFDVGREMFVTDGTASGTTLFQDIAPGTPSSFPYGFMALGQDLMFFARALPFAMEPWVSTTTPGTATMLFDVWPGPSDSVRFPSPEGFADVGVSRDDGVAIFVANDGTAGPEMWRTDGTVAGTWMVQDIALDVGPGTYPRLVAGRDLFYAAATTSQLPGLTYGFTIFATDGSPNSAVPIAPAEGQDFPLWRVGSDDTVLISSLGDFYASTGSAALTAVTDILPGATPASVRAGARLGNALIFRAHAFGIGTEPHIMPLVGSGAYIAESLGSGCGGSVPGGPLLSPTGTPTLGDAFGVSLHAAPTQSTAVFALSLPSLASPTPSPLGCDWLLGATPLVLAALPTGAGGSAAISGTIPPTPQIAGSSVIFQAAIGQTYLTAITNGVEVVFGM